MIPTSRFPNVRELLRCHNKLATVEMAPLKSKQNKLDCPQLFHIRLLLFLKFFLFVFGHRQQIIMVLLLCVSLQTACEFSVDTCQ